MRTTTTQLRIVFRVYIRSCPISCLRSAQPITTNEDYESLLDTSTAKSDDNLEISENAALRRSMSASSFSARSFIYDHKGALVISSLPWESVCADLILTYSSNGIAGSDKLMMVIVY